MAGNEQEIPLSSLKVEFEAPKGGIDCVGFPLESTPEIGALNKKGAATNRGMSHATMVVGQT